ncbi:MAG: phosphoenolpyruvate synthase [Euryarchaeota archaeon]|nr:phosphoenolpyruvate synthase [Euryarchaeota archaeon]
MKWVVWAGSVGRKDLVQVGGKGANLGELLQLGLPVPPAYVVTAHAFTDFLQKTGAGEKIFKMLDSTSVDDTKALHETADEVRALILKTPMPEDQAKEVTQAYATLSAKEKSELFVAVRSSATAEDLPEASFAGQQDTFLYTREENLLENVQKCWASLYTPRAIFYRVKNKFDHRKVAIAVVVQKMVNSEKSGVMFTKHPTTGEAKVIIEGAWGLGEGVVSGAVSPDNYVCGADGQIIATTIASKETQFVRGKAGGTITERVDANRRQARVLDDKELARLFKVGLNIEKHYGSPQDIEWALEAGELYILQARPITTIKKKASPTAGIGASKKEGADGDSKPILVGLGASPGTAAGEVVYLKDASELDKCKDGNILVTTMTMPDMVPAMKRAVAIVTDEGGMTCHAAIVSRELGIPCIVGTKQATKVLKTGMLVTVDGEKGMVYGGKVASSEKPKEKTEAAAARVTSKPVTATSVKVNISMPEAIDRALAVEPDGVGLLRIEHIVIGLGTHPLTLIKAGKEGVYVDYLVDNIRKVADPMYPRPVWVRTLDAPTDEFKLMKGGESEPHEHNPMLGWRGIRRGLDQPELLTAEFKAIKKLHELGLTNVGVMLPLVQHPDEIRGAKAVMRAVGLEPHKHVVFGIMVEIPAAALIIDELLDEGLDFVSFGTNDLTQYTLAVDRNNENVAKMYTEFHPAVAKLIKMTIDACEKRGVESSICGQAGSNPAFVEKLIKWGITSVSTNIDALARVREMIARTETKILLEKARKDAVR